ncbi:MAG: hypothetical protein MO846_01875 [Candidatus Devosia symbiotica]|nr:hypothetical protein [Candidatus Devosia symbiotica]
MVNADEILVLREGVVAERGSHQDLLALDGLLRPDVESAARGDRGRGKLLQTANDPDGFVKRGLPAAE